jgi:hypothetical protein
MICKRKAIFTGVIIRFWLFVAAAQAQDILAFNDTTGLPNCAYSCTDLYSAQYDCQSAGDRVGCFCGTGYITTKANDWGCDEVCMVEEDKKRVTAFLAATCGTEEEHTGEDNNDQKTEGNGNENDNNEVSGSDNTTNTAEDKPSKKGSQTEKAMNWYGPAHLLLVIWEPTSDHGRWRKNWPYFFLAFMLVAIAILVVAFAGPVRKFIRRQIIGRRTRHSGQGVPPYWAPAAPAPTVSSAHAPSRYYSNAYNSTALRTWDGYLSSGAIGAYSGTAGPLGPALTPPPGQPGIRTLFATQLSAEPSPRQESWERRIRREYEGRGWSRLAFWRKGPADEAGAAEKRVLARSAHVGRAV